MFSKFVCNLFIRVKTKKGLFSQGSTEQIKVTRVLLIFFTGLWRQSQFNVFYYYHCMCMNAWQGEGGMSMW